MDTVLAQTIINGLLLGGVYAAYSAGFSLIFGVMGVVNLAHGELIMLGAFTSVLVVRLFQFGPLLKRAVRDDFSVFIWICDSKIHHK